LITRKGDEASRSKAPQGYRFAGTTAWSPAAANWAGDPAPAPKRMDSGPWRLAYSALELSPWANGRPQRLWGNPGDRPGPSRTWPRPGLFSSIASYVTPVAGPALLRPGPLSGALSTRPPNVDGRPLGRIQKKVSYYHRVTAPGGPE